MTVSEVQTKAGELLKGMMQKGWQPNGIRPDDCGDYRSLVEPVWTAWLSAEEDEPGQGYVAARAAWRAIDPEGKHAFLLSGDPKPLPNSEKDYKAQDYVTVLTQLGYTFALNECDDSIEVSGEPLTDVLEATIRSELRDRGLRSLLAARDAYIAGAKRNSYHPIKQKLESLSWDGRDHIGDLAGHFRDKHGVFPLYLPKFLIGCVAKVYKGAQNRMLVLDGPQNIGKSYFARWLASPFPYYFLENPIDPDNKDHMIRLAKTFIWEVGELGSTMRRTDREALKYFLTMEKVTVRKPYDRYDVNKPAMASFIGTVNNTAGFLNDPTGSRRFMVVTLERINRDYTSIDIDQIWAQAYALYKAGKTGELTPDEAARASDINAEYEVEDSLESYLVQYFEIDPSCSRWELSTADILEQLHNSTHWHLGNSKAEAMAVAEALRKLKLEKTKFTVEGTKARVNGYTGIRRRQVVQPVQPG